MIDIFKIDIPKEKIVVFTGVSGSGKSSIVFDTIAAESQRQMNETYSAFIRGRLPKYEKPKVELIQNLADFFRKFFLKIPTLFLFFRFGLSYPNLIYKRCGKFLKLFGQKQNHDTKLFE